MTIVKFSEIEHLLTSAINFDKQNVYEKEYSNDDFFVLYENDIILENLSLHNYVGDKFIEGYIFKQNLDVNVQISSIDTDYSPFLFVLGNVKCPGLILAGNEFYIGGNLECNSLWGIYNHGSLTVKRNLKTQLLYSDEFNFEFGSVSAVAYIIGDERAKYNDANGLGLVLMTKTHSLNQVFNDYGQELCNNGLFEYLTTDNENPQPILRTELDFYQNFPEKSRLSFSEIFSNPLFIDQQNIEIASKNTEQPNIFYSFTTAEDTNSVVVINTNRNYSASIVLDKQADKIYLTLALFTDHNLKDIQIYFEMNEQDQYFQAKTVKHWFFEAQKEWQLNNSHQ